jgi:hypothetical protein
VAGPAQDQTGQNQKCANQVLGYKRCPAESGCVLRCSDADVQQGRLTLLGLTLVDLPGKRALERWIIE